MKNQIKINDGTKYYILFAAFGIICIIVDVLAKTDRVPHIVIGEEYIYYVFAAIATVGALGSTILSIAQNSNNTAYLCFSVKEICGFKKSPIHISTMLICSIGVAAKLRWPIADGLACPGKDGYNGQKEERKRHPFSRSPMC